MNQQSPMNMDAGKPARAVPAGHAIAWVIQTLALMKTQPARLFLIVVLFQLIMGLTQIPLVGLLLLLSVPALSAGVLQALHVTAQGGAPSPSLLFVPLTTPGYTFRLWGLGGLIFLAGIFVITLLMPSAEVMPDQEVLNRIEAGDIEALNQLDMEALQGLAFAFLVGLTISGTLSYLSIPLIWFHNRPLGTSVVDGLKALMINWKAFLVLGLLIAALLIPVSIVGGILFASASGQGLMSMLMMASVMILVLGFQLVLFGTQYCAFRDIFGMSDPVQSKPDDSDDNQLVA